VHSTPYIYAYLLYTMLLAEPFVNYCYMPMPMTPIPPRAPNFKGAFDHLQTPLVNVNVWISSQKRTTD